MANPETPANNVKPNEVKRRDFVKAAGVAGAAAVAALPRAGGAPGVLRAQTAANRIKYGFIGPGSRGLGLLRRHLANIELGECVALCDIYEPNLKKALDVFDGKPTPYTDYRKLLEQQDVEAVFIATPLYAHFGIMKDALEAGKHVFCEKSLVFKPEEVHALRALHAERPNQVLQVGLQRRYSAFYQTAKQMIDAGMIGKVTHVQAQWNRNTSWRRSLPDPSMEEQINWRLYRAYSGGLSAELMSHQVDVADWMMDSSPVSVMGVGGIDYWKDGREVYDNIHLIFEYPDGQKMTYTSLQTNRHLQGRRLPGDSCREVILGTDGAIEITLAPGGEGMWFVDPMPEKMGEQKAGGEAWTAGATVADALEQGEGLPIIPGIRDLDSPNVGFIEREVEFARRWLYKKGIMMPTEDKHPEYKELESFLTDVRDGGKPKADIEVGLRDSIAVMLSILSMDEERKVKFSEIEALGRDVNLTDASSGQTA